MNEQLALGADAVFAGLGEIRILDDLPGEGGPGKARTFHVILVEMLALERAVEALERLHGNRKGKAALVHIYDAVQFLRRGFDVL